MLYNTQDDEFYNTKRKCFCLLNETGSLLKFDNGTKVKNAQITDV